MAEGLVFYHLSWGRACQATTHICLAFALCMKPVLRTYIHCIFNRNVEKILNKWETETAAKLQVSSWNNLEKTKNHLNVQI